MSTSLTDKLISLHRHIARLKTSPRRGWVRRGVSAPESVADHVFGTSMLALVAARELGLDQERVVITALIHELCEAIVGDIIPADGVPPEEKQKLEERAAAEVLAEIDESGELLELWRDFEHGRTPEGKLVKELDRLEMALQASDYEKRTGLDLSEFHRSARASIDHDDFVTLLDRLTAKVEGD